MTSFQRLLSEDINTFFQNTPVVLSETGNNVRKLFRYRQGTKL